MIKQDLWEENIKYYRELVDKYNFDLESMLTLLKRLEKERFYNLFYPSNSHEALGLSLFDNYSDRCDNPMIYISYVSETSSFIIFFQTGQGKTSFKETIYGQLTHSHFQKIKNWLLPAIE